MKISKTLREYIEEQVNIKANESKTIAELKAKADEATAKLDAERKELQDEWNKIWKSVTEKYGVNLRYPASVSLNGAHSMDLPEVIAYNKAEIELCEKKRLAVLNIIAEMELGGTKAELMEKLSNLQF